MKIIPVILLFLCIYACSEERKNNEMPSESSKEINVPNNLVQGNDRNNTDLSNKDSIPEFPSMQGDISYLLFENEDHTWGYELMAGGKAIIRQSSIPSLPGNHGFASKEKAEIVAKHLQMKMQKGEFPGIDSLELKKLNAIP